ncbi:DUF1993 domain-containing protein [Uliginosibacterium sediminicola]|uniref:DUF1993 domain-containing protein n=1 Tax=Uliginosibacterium sediminicola TaxID=2024550 RepID=A0ABU9Z3G4_9RHOO
MSLSMYQAFIPPAIRALNNLAAIVDKIAAHAEARKIAPEVLIGARLFPDMLPFVKQIQIASDTVKGGAARLAGVEAPVFVDDEASFAELQARIQKTIAYLQSFKPEQIDGSEDKDITVAMRSGDLHFKGQAYLLGFVIPNLYFHISTAYAIARSNGVELGKRDFLGKE